MSAVISNEEPGLRMKSQGPVHKIFIKKSSAVCGEKAETPNVI